MKKPPTLSPEALTSKELLVILKKKEQWTNKELLELLLPQYTAYDRDGLNHRLRHVLHYLSKQEKIVRVERGTYSVK